MSIYSQSNAGSKALLKAKAEFRLARAAGGVKLEAVARQWIASGLHMSGQPEQSVKYANEAREMLKAFDRRAEARACILLATYLADVQRHDEAHKACTEAMAIREELGDTPGVGQCLQLAIDMCL